MRRAADTTSLAPSVPSREYSLRLGQLTPFTPYTVKVSMRPGVEGALHCTGPLKSVPVPPILGRLQAAPCTQGGLGEQGGGGGWQGRCAVQADGGEEGAGRTHSSATQFGARTNP